MGPSLRRQALRVAGFGFFWSIAIGLALSLIMLLGQNTVINLIVPTAAINVFIPAWIVSAVAQPVNALTYATDGVGAPEIFVF